MGNTVSSQQQTRRDARTGQVLLGKGSSVTTAYPQHPAPQKPKLGNTPTDSEMLKWRKRNKPKVVIEAKAWFLGRWFTHAITENAISRLRAHIRITRGQRAKLRLTTEGVHAIPRAKLIGKNDGEFILYHDLEALFVDEKYINIIILVVRLSESQLELMVYRCVDESEARAIVKAGKDCMNQATSAGGDKPNGPGKLNWTLKSKGGENKKVFSSAAHPPNWTVRQLEEALKQRQIVATQKGATVTVKPKPVSPKQPVQTSKQASPPRIVVENPRQNPSPSPPAIVTKRVRNGNAVSIGTHQRAGSFQDNITLKVPQDYPQTNDHHLRHNGTKTTKLSTGNRLPNGVPLVDIPVDNNEPNAYLRDKVVNLTKELERLKHLIEDQDARRHMSNGSARPEVKRHQTSHQSSPKYNDVPDSFINTELFESEADSSSGVEVTLQRNPQAIPYVGHGVRANVDDYRKRDRSPSPQRRVRDPKEMLDRHGQRVHQAMIQTLDPKEKTLSNNTRGRLTRRQERDSGNDSMSRISGRSMRSAGNRSRASSAALSQRSSSGTRVNRRIEDVYNNNNTKKSPGVIVYYKGREHHARSQSASRVESRRPVALVW